jgi:hypothetical protein
MWRLYGNNGFGTALVFQIDNYENRWNDVYFGKVHYGDSNKAFKKLKAFIKFHQSFNAKHKVLENYPHWIPVMCMLHKNGIWKIENEYRLFSFCPFDKYTHSNEPDIRNYLMYGYINHFVNQQGKKVAYTYLPLDLKTLKEEFDKKLKGIEGGAESLFSSLPHFRLKRIIIGYNVSVETAHNIFDCIDLIAEKKLNYKVECGFSTYKKLLG